MVEALPFASWGGVVVEDLPHGGYWGVGGV